MKNSYFSFEKFNLFRGIPKAYLLFLKAAEHYDELVLLGFIITFGQRKQCEVRKRSSLLQNKYHHDSIRRGN